LAFEQAILRPLSEAFFAKLTLRDHLSPVCELETSNLLFEKFDVHHGNMSSEPHVSSRFTLSRLKKTSSPAQNFDYTAFLIFSLKNIKNSTSNFRMFL